MRVSEQRREPLARPRRHPPLGLQPTHLSTQTEEKPRAQKCRVPVAQAPATRPVRPHTARQQRAASRRRTRPPNPNAGHVLAPVWRQACVFKLDSVLASKKRIWLEATSLTSSPREVTKRIPSRGVWLKTLDPDQKQTFARDVTIPPWEQCPGPLSPSD